MNGKVIVQHTVAGVDIGYAGLFWTGNSFWLTTYEHDKKTVHVRDLGPDAAGSGEYTLLAEGVHSSPVFAADGHSKILMVYQDEAGAGRGLLVDAPATLPSGSDAGTDPGKADAGHPSGPDAGAGEADAGSIVTTPPVREEDASTARPPAQGEDAGPMSLPQTHEHKDGGCAVGRGPAGGAPLFAWLALALVRRRTARGRAH